jgi:mRNA interferase HigB
MRIYNYSTLRECWQKYPDTENYLKGWHKVVEGCSWDSPADVKKTFANASFVVDKKVVFNVRGNKYRLIVDINYAFKSV